MLSRFFRILVALVAGIGMLLGATGISQASVVRPASNVFTSVPLYTIGANRVPAELLLTVVATGAWNPAPDSVNFEWKYGGTSFDTSGGDLGSGFDSTLSLDSRADLANEKVFVRITATKAGYSDRYVNSSLTLKKILRDTVDEVYISNDSNPDQAPSVGDTVASALGHWGSSVDYSIANVTTKYQWYRGDVKISGATKRTYTVASADLGHTLRLRITGKKSGYYDRILNTIDSDVVQVGRFSISKQPNVIGQIARGKKLTAKVGSWAPKPRSFTYRWLNDGVAIDGATSATYVLTDADVGHVIAVEVTGEKYGYSTLSETSAETDPIFGDAFSRMATPSIRGNVGIGKTLSIKYGSWSPQPSYFDVQWLRNGRAISGATDSTYRLTRDDAGKKITVRVAAQRANVAPASKTSKSVSQWKKKSYSKTVRGTAICAAADNIGGTFQPCGDSLFTSYGARVYSEGGGETMKIRTSISVIGKPVSWKLRFNKTWKDESARFTYRATDAYGSSYSARKAFPNFEYNNPYSYSGGESINMPSSSQSTGGRVYFELISTSYDSLYFDSVTITYKAWI